MLVFVYGTLMSGEYNNTLMSGSTMLGTYTTPPEYTMVDLGSFPGVVKGGTTAITGEVWEVEDLTILDSLEGHPDFYCREIIDTDFGQAWMYIWQGKIHTGYWRTRHVV